MTEELKNTTCVNLQAGGWIEAHQKLIHRTSRKMLNVASKYITVEDKGEKPAVDVDWKSVDWEEVNSVIMLSQVTAWSFGAVTQETLDVMPEDTVAEIQAVLDGMYGSPLAEALACDLRKASSGR